MIFGPHAALKSYSFDHQPDGIRFERRRRVKPEQQDVVSYLSTINSRMDSYILYSACGQQSYLNLLLQIYPWDFALPTGCR